MVDLSPGPGKKRNRRARGYCALPPVPRLNLSLSASTHVRPRYGRHDLEVNVVRVRIVMVRGEDDLEEVRADRCTDGPAEQRRALALLERTARVDATLAPLPSVQYIELG